eukprot:CAMPEP_0176314414 /NCGR_PEP_ID=MMETSP0121_2-20121125/67671_1 /TAXON_ID=160619 /ORGANISM="Kryptoperidinium foliaceum, Strain CCMP 1326" /LENGTH=50 /DNA_ID=CAMNT_0017656525 /DNA_START=143 /DNA_END=295 /DNA_ORIENTATION=+
MFLGPPLRRPQSQNALRAQFATRIGACAATAPNLPSVVPPDKGAGEVAQP